jgi:hypothetical protein
MHTRPDLQHRKPELRAIIEGPAQTRAPRSLAHPSDIGGSSRDMKHEARLPVVVPLALPG